MSKWYIYIYILSGDWLYYQFLVRSERNITRRNPTYYVLPRSIYLPSPCLPHIRVPRAEKTWFLREQLSNHNCSWTKVSNWISITCMAPMLMVTLVLMRTCTLQSVIWFGWEICLYRQQSQIWIFYIVTYSIKRVKTSWAYSKWVTINQVKPVSFTKEDRPWFLYWMVAHFTMRTYGVYRSFRFVEGIWLRKESPIPRKFSRKELYYIIRAQHVMSYNLI